MAKSDGSVIIDTLVDTKGFGKGLNTMEKQMGGLSKTIGKLGLAIGAAFAVGKLVQFGKEAIELGSDLQEVQNVVDVTFTTMSDKVNEFAQGAAEAAGLSETMAKKYMGTFGAMSKSFGFMEEEAFAMSASLTQAVGDVASFYNLSQEEAYTKLKAVFTGETESLKDLGVVMTQNALDAYAMAEGWGMTTAQMTEQQKVALRYRFVLDQLSAASGDFQRTSDGWANQMRILQLNIESLKANIGQGLINIFTPILKVINQIISKLAQLSSYFVAFSEMISGKQTSSGGGSPGAALAEIAERYEDVESSAKGAAKAQNKYLSGLDEIRTFSEADAGIGGVDAAGIGNIDLGIDAQTNTDLNNASDAIGAIKERLQELIDKFPILGNVVSIVQGSFELLKKVGIDLFNLLTKPITDNADGILLASKNIAEFVAGMVETIIIGFDGFIQELNTVYDEHIGPVFQSITQDISDLVGKFLEWFNNDMAPVLDRWGEKFDEVWENHIDPLLANFAEFFGVIAEGFGQIWHNRIEPFLDWCISTLLPFLTPVFEGIGNVVLDTVGLIADAFSALIDILGGVILYLAGTFTGDWETALDGLLGILKGIVNLLIVAVEDGLNKAIMVVNGLIDGLNLVGGAVGFNPIEHIPELELPRLATGAVIPPNAPFMAVLGDQKHGTNIEAPLDTIKQAVREVVGNGNSNGNVLHNVVQINRRTLLEEMIEEAKLRQSTSGRNPFDLA